MLTAIIFGLAALVFFSASVLLFWEKHLAGGAGMLAIAISCFVISFAISHSEGRITGEKAEANLLLTQIFCSKLQEEKGVKLVEEEFPDFRVIKKETTEKGNLIYVQFQGAEASFYVPEKVAVLLKVGPTTPAAATQK